MKTSASITIRRCNKYIVIFVDNGDFSKLPDLSFIADIEVYGEEKEESLWQQIKNSFRRLSSAPAH